MKIKIISHAKISILPKTFIYLEVLFFLNKQWIIELLHLPAFVGRLDFVFVFLGYFFVIFRFKEFCNAIKEKWVGKWLLFFNIIILLGWLFNGMSIVRGLWAYFVRTVGIVAFFPLCIGCLEIKDVKKIFKILCYTQLYNMIFIIYQCFVLGIRGDYLGGIFGTVQGANGNTNIFQVVLFTYLLAGIIEKKISMKKFIFFSLTFVVSAALSDIAAFYIEIIIAAGVVFAFMRFNKKKINFLLIGIGGIGIAILLFAIIYPERFAFLANLENLKAYIGIGSEYNGVYGISRINPYRQINDMYFKDNYTNIFVGYGLGNCEYSEGFKILQSPFFLENRYFRYYWFTTAMTYIEMGIGGTLVYAIFIFRNFVLYRKMQKKKYTYGWGLYGCALIANYFFIFLYNNSLNLSAGYLMYFALAVPYVCKRCLYDNQKIGENGVS